MGNNVGAALVGGGIPPSAQQTALSQYNLGQGTLRGMGTFGPNMPESTNLTQAAVSGPEAGFAEQQGSQSLANTSAMTNFLNSQFQNFAGGLGNIVSKIGGGGGGSGGGSTGGISSLPPG